MIKECMYFFLFIALPGILLIPSVLKKSCKELVFPCSIGFLFGALTCMFNAFFVFSTHCSEFNFREIFLRILVFEYLIPLVALAAVFFIVSKGNLALRIKSFLPCWTAFFAVTVPYFTLAGKYDFSFFELFAKPVLVAVFLLASNACIQLLFEDFFNKTKKYFRIFEKAALFAAVLICSAAVQSLWFYGMPFWVWFSLFAVFTAASFYCVVKSHTWI